MRGVPGFAAWTMALVVATAGTEAAGGDSRMVTVGTAAVMGVYYPVGGAICRMVNVTRRAHQLRCSVEPSEGSVANIRDVLAGDVDLGIAQSDTQYYALKGEGPFQDHPQEKLRVLFSVYPELVTLVARSDAHIAKFEDIKGKRVAIGTAGSGTRATMQLLMSAFGIRRTDLKSAAELKFLELGPALCENRIDAFVFVAGHPNLIFSDVANTCPTHIVPIAGPPVDRLLAQHPYYAKADIPGRLYRGTDEPQPSFGTMATVVVSADMPDTTAYAITKAVFENFDDFRKLHPAIANIRRDTALKADTAPFHPGAVRYFKEAGLM